MLATIESQLVSGKITREAFMLEIQSYTPPSNVRINVNRRIRSGSLVGNYDPRFMIKKDTMYCNRYGYLVTITDVHNDIAKSEVGSYNINGKLIGVGPTMNDLIAMVA